ncbi:uncharacterized protein EV422DRAFT_563674 [Fimicolochytrium jonesii]|uniref:uncharacterized protein n=1 Tax=Fimicolochytrium jonesii TaxID=1396493 RepID=UPI0022FEF88B|nr:uncharacterized protein EV422DRAFT_563674 [Fimicolochytrium jonesii]KAI8825845.1 hypothetical protein EV422DRAFT_563674 [Fimicolochytrium jonesii]
MSTHHLDHIRCTTCHSEQPRSAFQDLEVRLYGKDKTYKITSKGCTVGQTNYYAGNDTSMRVLQCTECDEVLPYNKFSQRQRKERETARCLTCVGLG